MTLTGWGVQLPEKLLFGDAVKILNMAQTIASGLQRTDCLLEGFLVGLADAHDFAYRSHLGSQLIFYPFEFLKSPAGEFDYHIVTVRNIFVQGAVLAALDIFKRKSAGQHSGNQGDGKTGGLGG